MFGFGVFTQLLDDLEDTENDLQGGLMTIFSQTAGHWPLDALTSRTFHLGAKVLARLDAFDGPGAEPLKELMKKEIVQVLFDAAARAGRFHSKRYLQALEVQSPIRFSFLHRLRQQLTRQGTSLMTLVEVFAAPLTLSPEGRGKGEGRDHSAPFDPSENSARTTA
jgi:hypothetical protein